MEKIYRVQMNAKGMPNFSTAVEVVRWIPCEERLPNDNREVLISLEWGIDIGMYERGEWRSEWINHYDDDNVLAWMPLPKPYGEREGER